jgi:hypothetical protein
MPRAWARVGADPRRAGPPSWGGPALFRHAPRRKRGPRRSQRRRGGALRGSRGNLAFRRMGVSAPRLGPACRAAPPRWPTAWVASRAAPSRRPAPGAAAAPHGDGPEARWRLA